MRNDGKLFTIDAWNTADNDRAVGVYINTWGSNRRYILSKDYIYQNYAAQPLNSYNYKVEDFWQNCEWAASHQFFGLQSTLPTLQMWIDACYYILYINKAMYKCMGIIVDQLKIVATLELLQQVVF